MANPYYANFAAAFDAPMQQMQAMAANAQAMQIQAQQAPLDTRIKSAQAERLERGLTESSELRALFADFKPDPEAPTSETLTRMGTQVARLDPVLGGQLLGRATTAAGQEERAERQRAAALRARAQGAVQLQNWLEGGFGLIEDEATFNEIKLGKLASPNVMANPELGQMVEGLSWEQYQALRSTARLEAQAAAAATREAQVRVNQQNAATNAERVRLQAERTAGLAVRGSAAAKQEGPRAARNLTAADRKDALTYVRNAPELKGLETAGMVNLANDLASRTIRLMHQRPQLSVDEARAVALGDLEKAGLITREPGGFGRGEKLRYTPMSPAAASKLPSGAPAAPIPLPTDLSNFKPDPAAIYIRGNVRYRYDAARNGLAKVQ